MERRDFVKSGILGVVVPCLFPVSFIGTPVNSEIINVVDINVKRHVRHGLLNPTVGDRLDAGSWLKNFRKEVFYKNGISASKEDMIGLSFDMNNQSVNLHKIGKNVLVKTKRNSERFDLTGQENVKIFVEDNYECILISVNDDFLVPRCKECYIVPLSKGLTINSTRINESQMAVVNLANLTNENRHHHLKVVAPKNQTLVLLIIKK